jgi:hypothetical protein
MSALFVLRTPALRGCYRTGRWRARYLHVSTTPREIVRGRVQAIATDGPEALRQYLGHSFRERRRAIYLGIMAGLRAERRLMQAFNL